MFMKSHASIVVHVMKYHIMFEIALLFELYRGILYLTTKFLTWYPSSRMWSGRAASRLAVAPEDPVAPAAAASVEPAAPAAPLPESMAARSSAARSAGGGPAKARRIRGS